MVIHISKNRGTTNWEAIANKPPILDDGQISWGEVQDKPFVQGEFTPLLTNINNFNLTHLSQNASYYKVGNLVFIAGVIHTATPATFPSGQLEIRNLPFGGLANQIFLGMAQTQGLVTNITVVPKIEGNNKILLFQQANQQGNTFWTILGVNNFNQNNQFKIQFQISYLTT